MAENMASRTHYGEPVRFVVMERGHELRAVEVWRGMDEDVRELAQTWMLPRIGE